MKHALQAFYKIACFLVLIAICVFILSHAIRASTGTDLVSYWAAGKQLADHANPYDRAQAFQQEKAEGYTMDRPLVMRNPPTALFLAAPLGHVSLQTALTVWTLLLMVSVMCSVKLLWLLNGSPPDRLHLVAYMFAPVLCCLVAGQMGIFLLAGITTFLYLIRRQPFEAGCALVFVTLKPHLFIPFGLVALLWLVSRRKFSVLAGFACATGIALSCATYLDPHCWHHFLTMLHQEPVGNEIQPTLSVLLRLATPPHSSWLEFIPIAAACVWAAFFYVRNSSRWRWEQEGLLVLTVSIVFAPYGLFTDQAVLLPATLALLYRTSNAGKSLIPFALIAGAALIQVMFSVQLFSFLYIWPAPALLAWQIHERLRLSPESTYLADPILDTSAAQ